MMVPCMLFAFDTGRNDIFINILHDYGPWGIKPWCPLLSGTKISRPKCFEFIFSADAGWPKDMLTCVVFVFG